MRPEQIALRERHARPTERQVQIVETVRELGSVERAATELRIARVTIQAAIARYHHAVCDERIDELEAEVARLRDLDLEGQKIRRLDALVGRLEATAQPVSHRRLADGGIRVKDQRRSGRGDSQ